VYLPSIAPDETRIGVSIPVPEPWSTEIANARISYGDRYAQMIPPHITIVGPTVVKLKDLPALVVALDNTCDQFPKFTISLAGTGTFRPISPVSFINVVQGASECGDLAARAMDGMLAQAPRFPFHPHVTLAHEVPEPVLDQAQADFANLHARFSADALWLYRHHDDGVWRKQCKFDLRGQQPGRVRL